MARRIKYTPQLSMSFATMEEEIVDRSSSRGVSQVSMKKQMSYKYPIFGSFI